MKFYAAALFLAPVVAANNLRVVPSAEHRELDVGNCTATDITFEGFNNGEKVRFISDRIEVKGQRINRKGVLKNRKDRAMIFDTSVPSDADPDLNCFGSEPNRTCNMNVGNALIITEDYNTTYPDDNAYGGLLSFHIDPPFKSVECVQLLDIDDNDGVRGPSSIEGETSTGTSLPIVMVPEQGDNSLQCVNTPNYTDVKKLIVNLGGSGAIPKIRVHDCPEEPECPEVCVSVACAKCGSILECYIDDTLYSNTTMEYNSIEAYLNSTGDSSMTNDTDFFCDLDMTGGRTPAGQQCAQAMGTKVYPASSGPEPTGLTGWCPVTGDSGFKCFEGREKMMMGMKVPAPAALSNWATYKFKVDCNGNVMFVGHSMKCDTGTCSCAYGNDVFCANCTMIL